MAVLRIEIAGNPRTIPFRTVLRVGASSIGMLDDLDHAFSHQPQGATEWLIHDASINGALRIELASRVRLLKRKNLPDVGQAVASSFVHGLKVIEDQGLTPEYLSEVGMRYASRMTDVLGTNGAQRLIATLPEQQNNKAEVTKRAVENIAKLLQAPYESLGSVEGHLEGINLHKSPRFIVYEKRTNKAVTCLFGTFRGELMQKVKDSLEHRVSVSGRLFRNSKGEPVRIKLLSPSDLKVFGTDLKVLPFKSLGGSDPDCTGDVSVREYIRRLRE